MTVTDVSHCAYWIIDVETPEQAYQIAARASAAPGPGGRPGNMPIEVPDDERAAR
jgi:hypothetical protein